MERKIRWAWSVGFTGNINTGGRKTAATVVTVVGVKLGLGQRNTGKEENVFEQPTWFFGRLCPVV